MRLWDAGNRVVGDDFGESKRLTTDIAAHHAITIERVISFIEHQVEHVEDRCHARRKHLRFDHSKRNPVLANVTFRADEALGYRALVGQIGPANLTDAEPADGLECERYPRVWGYRGGGST